MGFKCGIVGLPNVGKSTLFNALTQTANAQAANYPFCTIEPNVGDVAVPEPRLDNIAKIGGSAQKIPARMNFVDIAGLVRGASKGEGLGNQFLANIRETDAIIYVLRCFEDDDVTHVDAKAWKMLQLLTAKPVLYVANVDEDSAADGNDHSARVFEHAKAEGAQSVAISAKIESELALLEDADERKEYLDALGLTEPGLDRLIRAGYALLGLQTYFTVGPKEARAWTFKDGWTAPKCAGVIHGDFERGFIKAETTAYEDYVANDGEQGAKEAGKVRQEGKEYLVKDGDIMLFKFNV